MNPSTDEILDGIDRTRAPEAVVLANNPNVIMAAEQAARLATAVKVIPSRSLTAGLAAMVGYEGLAPRTRTPPRWRACWPTCRPAP